LSGNNKTTSVNQKILGGAKDREGMVLNTERLSMGQPFIEMVQSPQLEVKSKPIKKSQPKNNNTSVE